MILFSETNFEQQFLFIMKKITNNNQRTFVVIINKITIIQIMEFKNVMIQINIYEKNVFQE